ncbi:murein DD-endopeptidase MepM/ murein hydrolase activator NlpD/SH3-like domain-containing protein [Pontibacter aydingkolensis]|uniref:Peptidoglycan DD-metalloendopeptidase family protein n=1 Tax=Pontibacter aydingkolensis TaxID=1911536 RepID=A0ABS7CVS4_9BACT|nr:peptidoglycan DD-metalloendopeptidase family protein [Pontibacter aydingkolensis]MBW7467951.1 peptidoglycan DD-metalloendopeptidase family protein [Pontibacter aydingkolensis]
MYPIKRDHLNLFLFFLILALATSCGAPQTLRTVFKNQTPYEGYVVKIKDAKLDQTGLGQDWLRAGEKALQDSLTITLPYKETGYFSADKPRALGYKIDAKRGERIVVNLEVKARKDMQIFMDMFEVENTATNHVATTDTTGSYLVYEVDDDSQHVLRVQPELLRSGQYTLTIKSEPTLAFPVAGKTSRNIASIWGDPRDNGARLHEGVDVFAKRGTPVVASSPGIVSRVGTTPRGGKVVWLADYERRQNLYYAHLDSQAVTAGQRIQIGDTLGFVGNTGNAKGTNPHLHFGIYRYGQGPTNPFPYLHASNTPVPPVQADASKIGNWVRVAARSANVRQQPSVKSGVYRRLSQYTPLLVTGATASWYRVVLPNGTEAYIAGSLIEVTTKPIKYEKLATQTDLLDNASIDAPAKDSLNPGSSVAVLGGYNGYTFVKAENGALGWVQKSLLL